MVISEDFSNALFLINICWFVWCHLSVGRIPDKVSNIGLKYSSKLPRTDTGLLYGQDKDYYTFDFSILEDDLSQYWGEAGGENPNGEELVMGHGPIMCADGGDVRITPTNLDGGSYVALDAVGDTVVLLFNDSAWKIIGGNGYTVA